MGRWQSGQLVYFCVYVLLTFTHRRGYNFCMGIISDSKLKQIRNLYYQKGLCMQEIANQLGVSIDAVVYFMRRHNLKRRSFFEINKLRFEEKEPSFRIRSVNSLYAKELKAIGIMLYYGEGYKSDKSSFVDFANSDPDMILLFMNFLRRIYKINEKKLRVLLYCYANQNIDELVRFWSGLTKIPRRQFVKPYIRKDFREDGRKMEYGLVHIRYMDKKLLLSIKGFINDYKQRFGAGSPVGGGSGL